MPPVPNLGPRPELPPFTPDRHTELPGGLEWDRSGSLDASDGPPRILR
jgi:hypothetical protein